MDCPPGGAAPVTRVTLFPEPPNGPLAPSSSAEGFRIGEIPSGQKEREHDFRTPEGHYYLSRRNTRSDYFLAIQVSYPNKEDEVRARKNRWAPGGSIMIHGFPNTPKHPAAYYEANDWTDGCIALSNSDMVEVWMRTQDNIPIDIYP